MSIKAIASFLAIIAVLDVCSGNTLKEWAESWLMKHSDIRPRVIQRIRDIENISPTRISGEQFMVISANAPVLLKDNVPYEEWVISVKFEAKYTATVVWEEHNPKSLAGDISGEILIPSYLRTKEDYHNPETSGLNRTVNLILPTTEDAGLLEALKPHKQVVLSMLKETLDTYTEEDVKVNKIENSVGNFVVEYSCTNEYNFYGIYYSYLSKGPEFVLTVTVS